MHNKQINKQCYGETTNLRRLVTAERLTETDDGVKKRRQ